MIIDEAHNLLETIANIHSVVLTYQQLACTVEQLSEYLRRYDKRLTARNLLHTKQILFIAKSFMRLLDSKGTEIFTHAVSSNRLVAM